jgi:hypothetical protein
MKTKAAVAVVVGKPLEIAEVDSTARAKVRFWLTSKQPASVIPTS